MIQKHETVFIGLAGVVLVGIYYVIFGQFYPNMHGPRARLRLVFAKTPRRILLVPCQRALRHPLVYSGVLRRYSVAPRPQSIFYSVPQWLSFVTDPLTSVYLTVLLFAALGFVGFYLLLRRVFETSPWSALLGAGLFLFNGFYAHRMIVGHLTYHPFMLLPTLAFFLLRPLPPQPPQRLSLAYDVVMAGVLMAYIFQAGMVNAALPVLASVVVIGLLHSLMQQQSTMFYRRLLLGEASPWHCVVPNSLPP